VVSDPRYATAVGLCLDTFDQDLQTPLGGKGKKRKGEGGGGRFGRIKEIFEAWF
jgi:hypothetical protein